MFMSESTKLGSEPGIDGYPELDKRTISTERLSKAILAQRELIEHLMARLENVMIPASEATGSTTREQVFASPFGRELNVLVDELYQNTEQLGHVLGRLEL